MVKGDIGPELMGDTKRGVYIEIGVVFQE